MQANDSAGRPSITVARQTLKILWIAAMSSAVPRCAVD
ncbi:hypothetical protein BLSMQ_1980 [Brevibacterium aurantiacum]|uniref:Uncharacterized protein n=1 Tax=Brevibacterium aurantiacum TaxID=273384 RepID=A0A1D7W411_BREAU|nr:hypothetical protein BLSMQ_1980 [Brevibacterium aurantiacum]